MLRHGSSKTGGRRREALCQRLSGRPSPIGSALGSALGWIMARCLADPVAGECKVGEVRENDKALKASGVLKQRSRLSREGLGDDRISAM